MARILRNLRINEISSVDRGAGDGVKVVLMKRNDNASRDDASSQRHKRLRRIFSSVDYSNFNKMDPAPAPDDVEDVDDDYSDDAKLSPALEQMVSALITAAPSLSRETAVHFLLHTAHGRALAEHMASTNKRKEPIMDRAAELRSIAKDFGIEKLASLIVTDGDAHGITEHELTQLASEEFAKHKLPGERSDTTFSRMYSSPESLTLRKAMQFCKSYPQLLDLQPTQVGGNDALAINDARKAYAQLQTMAAELRRCSPTLTAAQAFARVFEDQANATLAAQAHQRPSATSYAPR